MTAGLTFGVLGTVEARRDDVPLLIGGAKQRILLAVLALDRAHLVSADRLVDSIWGENVPATALNTLQVYASNLRRALGADAAVLRYQRPGYLLDVDPQAVDLGRFEALISQARADRRTGDLAQASRAYTSALAQWRGPALADLAEEPFAAGTIVRLESERLTAREEQAEVELALGRHSDLIGPLQRLVVEHPLRERTYGLLMLALYRAGRQAEALQAYRDVREQLADQLGLDPGPELRELEASILAQSPTLLAASAAPSVPRWDPTVSVPRDTPIATASLVTATGEVHPLAKPRVLLGRADECDVVAEDVRASRRHAMIRAVADSHEIVDLDSTNGTWVNGAELGPNLTHLLQDGDDVQIGETHLRYQRQR